MLNELYKGLEKRGLKFFCCLDDWIIAVQIEKENIIKFIEKKLGLKANIEKSKIVKPNYGIYYNPIEKIKPKHNLKSIQKFKWKIKQFKKCRLNISLKERILKLN